MPDHEIPFAGFSNLGKKFGCVGESRGVREIKLEKREKNRGMLRLEACGDYKRVELENSKRGEEIKGCFLKKELS